MNGFPGRQGRDRRAVKPRWRTHAGSGAGSAALAERREEPHGRRPLCGAAARLRADRVQALQQLVRRQLDLLVAPLGGAVVTGDEAHAMYPPEVSVDERVAGLGLVCGALGETEVPSGVLVPGVGGQECVVLLCSRLD